MTDATRDLREGVSVSPGLILVSVIQSKISKEIIHFVLRHVNMSVSCSIKKRRRVKS